MSIIYRNIRLSWKKPHVGWFKINFDGYADTMTSIVVAGFDRKGRLLSAEGGMG